MRLMREVEELAAKKGCAAVQMAINRNRVSTYVAGASG